MDKQQLPPPPERVWRAVVSLIKRETQKWKSRPFVIYPIPSFALGIDTDDYPRVSIHVDMDRPTRAIMFEASMQYSPGSITKTMRGMFVPIEDKPWTYQSQAGDKFQLYEIVRLIFGILSGS